MKVYQLTFGVHTADGYYPCGSRVYASREEAEKALQFSKSIPEDPCSCEDSDAFITELDVIEKFEPWISEEKLKEMQEEVNDYWRYWENREREMWEDYEDEIP